MSEMAPREGKRKEPERRKKEDESFSLFTFLCLIELPSP